jgi:hypothetical protein
MALLELDHRSHLLTGLWCNDRIRANGPQRFGIAI